MLNIPGAQWRPCSLFVGGRVLLNSTNQKGMPCFSMSTWHLRYVEAQTLGACFLRASRRRRVEFRPPLTSAYLQKEGTTKHGNLAHAGKRVGDEKRQAEFP